MDVLTSETCWALNKITIKQVASSWSLFTQLSNHVVNCKHRLTEHSSTQTVFVFCVILPVNIQYFHNHCYLMWKVETVVCCDLRAAYLHTTYCTVAGSSVGIATELRAGLSGIEMVVSRFPARPDRPSGPPSLLYNGYWVFPGGRGGRCVGLTPSPPFSAEVLERVELYL